MADLLADMVMKPRYITRTQTAFVRALKFLNSGRGGTSESGGESLPAFNIHSLLRLHDMNPPIYVCAMTLLDAEVPEEPSEIRESQTFRNLIDRLGLQPSSTSRDVRNSHKASLVLLEVFTYMIIIGRARKVEEENKTARQSATLEYVPDELTA